MKTAAQLEQEYQEFVAKVGKACKDVSDAINELSPENLQRFRPPWKQAILQALIRRMCHDCATYRWLKLSFFLS